MESQHLEMPYPEKGLMRKAIEINVQNLVILYESVKMNCISTESTAILLTSTTYNQKHSKLKLSTTCFILQVEVVHQTPEDVPLY